MARLLPLLLFLVFSAVAHAQMTTGTTADGLKYTHTLGYEITITGYNGTSSTVSIPDSINGARVTSISIYAFWNCSSVTSVTISKNVRTIAATAFYYVHHLTSITVDSQNLFYSSVDGVLFNKGKSTLVQFPMAKTGNPYVIPRTVTAIGDLAFADCPNLTKVTIPDTITSVSNYMFSGCTGLASVTIPDSVTYIGSHAFSGCTGLTSVTMGNRVTRIGDYAFANCTQLTNGTIPDSVITSGSSLFSGCTKLASVTIPNNINSIGAGVFSNCPNVTSITISPGVAASGTCIGAEVFSNCTNLSSVTIGDGITSIGDSAFHNCYYLTSITIPDSVTSIGDYAFCGCYMTAVKIPNSVTAIGNEAFSYCSKLKNAVFMGDAPTIGTSVFASTASGFTVYYFNDKTGFSSAWNGYTAVNMGPSSPIPPWLLSKSLPYNADLQSTPNGDGVPLLMAYALNLDPARPQSGSMPRPAVTGDQMSLTYYAGSEGVTYSVESSTDLQTWDTTGVTVSAPDANNLRTATVPATGPRRFMRLVVRH